MIQTLFMAVGVEACLIVLLLVKTPFRKLLMLGIDRLKRGRGPVAVRTLAVTVFVVFASSVSSLVKIRRRSAGIEGVLGLNPTDQVLWSRYLLESSLIGLFLFLALIIDRMHGHVRELRVLKKGMKTVTQQSRMAEDTRKKVDEQLKAKEREIILLNEKISKMESDSELRIKEVKSAEANALALRKQSEGFLLEYDRLLEENQSLRDQLQSIDLQLSRSVSKKNS
ncbi:B-cell receptor-associated 31-like protein [Wolffia australiana]